MKSPLLCRMGLHKLNKYMYVQVTRRRSNRHGGKYHTNYAICERCGKLCYRVRRFQKLDVARIAGSAGGRRQGMKVYIAGKITGDPGYRDKFAAAEIQLGWQGHTVLNPAELPEGMSREDYMRICFAMIDVADAVVFLPDAAESAGARLEMAYCDYIGKEYETWSD